MYIKRIVLDGFKSYASRTEVKDFDTQFNAITGLNGSGKSNILDSICFVLGISKLDQVRVHSLQELVYKQGQAGITKATVSIEFDNRNKELSPIGYEHYDDITISRTIVVGGRNQYKINGSAAQYDKVKTLFHSVGLNVNNPHFLIMQGRITKVMNMKPDEILAMLAEAAGTRMFEVKKETAEKTIEKKQKKLDEIEAILKDEIIPTLTKLKNDRSEYLKYTTNMEEIERLQRFCVAWESYSSAQRLQELQEELDASQHNVQEMKTTQIDTEKELVSLEKQIDTAVAEKEKALEGNYRKLEKAKEDLSKDLVKATSHYENQKKSMHAEEKNRASLTKNLEAADKSLATKAKEVEKCNEAFLELAEKQDQLSTRMEELQRMYQNVSGGMGATSNDQSLNDLLIEAQRKAASASTESKQVQMRIKHNKSELKGKQKEIQQAEKEFKKLDAELKAAVKSRETLEKTLAKAQYDPAREQTVAADLRTAQEDVAKLQERVEDLSSKLVQAQFEFADPERGFDRNKVKGLVANLVKIKDNKAATALEVTAGGKLYQVVVDTDDTGKKLLKNGQLKRRVTIIPLNQINARTLSKDTVANAQKLVGPNKARLALEYVGYDSEVQSAMNYVFGNTLVCEDMLAAKTVTFDPSVRARSVTLDGDVFDPAGTLTGGSRPDTRPILEKLSELNTAKEELAQREQAVADLTKQLKTLRANAEKNKDAANQMELQIHQIALIEKRISQSSHSQASERLAAMEEAIRTDEAALDTLAKAEKEAQAEAKDLEKQIKDFASHREQQLKKIEKDLAASKKEAANATKTTKDKQNEKQRLEMEMEALEGEKESITAQSQTLDETIARMKQEVEVEAGKVAEHKARYDEAKAAVDEEKARISSCDKEIKVLTKRRDDGQKRISDLEVELKKAEHNLARIDKDQKNARRIVKQTEDKHPWIATEMKFFGKAGTDYDFSTNDPIKAQKRLAKLNTEQENIGRKVNKKVMAMFEKAEQEYEELMKKKEIVENDRHKIEKVIEELEEKKNTTLRATWEKVNKDFGSIFSTLLPGAFSKLEPPEGMSVLEGLEVRVAFGNVWKQSLSELSGGQRSLLALSLILALLLYKPAPLYILDEIDSALDLSHTQNIGQMIKAHFGQSQFVVVSLKEGMFNNANVLFRTKFVDGVSTVMRTVPDRPAITAAKGKAEKGGKKKPTMAWEAGSEVPDSAHKMKAIH